MLGRNRAFILFLFMLLMPVSGVAAQEGKIALSWWYFPLFGQTTPQTSDCYERRLADAFEARHPHITVTLVPLDFSSGEEKIQRAIQDGTVCNLLLDAPGRIMGYAKSGRLASLDDLFTPQFQADMQNEALLYACSFQNHFYMYPLSTTPFFMAFNKRMLEEAGVASLVREGWTAQDFQTVLVALQKAGFAPGALFYRDTGGDQGTRALAANLYGASITDKENTRYTTDSDAFVQGLLFLQQAVQRAILLTGDFFNGSTEIDRFVNGESSFSILWSAHQQKAHAAALRAHGVDVLEVPYPSSTGKARLEYLINGFALFKSENPAQDAAGKAFIQFVCDQAEWGPRSVVQSGCLPVRHSFGELYPGDAAMQQRAAWTNLYAPYYNTTNGFSKMRLSWMRMLRALLVGNVSPRDAALSFTKAANAGRAVQGTR